jgi:Holliday junction resolvase RusA-like endonuclease
MKIKAIYSMTIKGVPIAKKRPRFANGIVYCSQEKEKNKTMRNIKTLWQKEMIPAGVPVRVNMTFFFTPAKSEMTNRMRDALEAGEIIPHLKKKDKDNLEKFYLDCMNKIVFYDDGQVYAGETTKLYGLEDKVEIEIIIEEGGYVRNRNQKTKKTGYSGNGDGNIARDKSGNIAGKTKGQKKNTPRKKGNT